MSECFPEVIRWTHVWWFLDGIGLSMLGWKLRNQSSFVLGVGGMLFGSLATAHRFKPEILPLTGLPLAALAIGLLISRHWMLKGLRQSTIKKLHGGTLVWPGPVAILFVPLLVVTALVLRSGSSYMSVYEGLAWSYFGGGVLASTASIGAMGLTLQCITRWFVRISVGFSLAVGVFLWAFRVLY